MNSGGIAPAGDQRSVEYLTCYTEGSERGAIVDKIEEFPSITISSKGWNDILSSAAGAYAPLNGFVGEAYYRSFVATGQLRNGDPFGFPLLLLADEEDAGAVGVPGHVILRDGNGKNIALMDLREKFRIDRKELAKRLEKIGEAGPARPSEMIDEGDVALAGNIDILTAENSAFPSASTNDVLSARGDAADGKVWREIV